MGIKEFFKYTNEKLILFLILFYIPALVIFFDFTVGIYSHFHLLALLIIIVVAYVLTCTICLYPPINKFLKPTKYKWTLTTFFVVINIPLTIPFWHLDSGRMIGRSFIEIFSSGFSRELLFIPLILLHFYVYAAVFELIFRKIKKVDEVPVDCKALVKKWWFWLIVIILILFLILELMDYSPITALLRIFIQ